MCKHQKLSDSRVRIKELESLEKQVESALNQSIIHKDLKAAETNIKNLQYIASELEEKRRVVAQLLIEIDKESLEAVV